jgi:biofilm PGA synthesis protein PgaD
MAAVDPNTCIDAPGLLTAKQRARDSLITAGMWGAYLYLWVPLISLGAWLLGFEFAYDVMVRAGGARDLVHVLRMFGVAIALIFLVVTVWSYSNRARYRGHNRRHAGPAVSDESLIEYFGIDGPALDRLRATRRVEIDFAADGRPQLAQARDHSERSPAKNAAHMPTNSKPCEFSAPAARP